MDALPYAYPCKPTRLDPQSDLFKRLANDILWIAEIKKNGWRCLAYRNADDLVLWTRHKTIIKDALVPLRSELLRLLPPFTVIDGELTFTRRVKGAPDKFYAFDVIYDKGIFMANTTLVSRRENLERLMREDTDNIELAKWTTIGKNLLYERVIEDDLLAEGIVLKSLSGLYPVGRNEGRENPTWLKVKRMESWQRQ